MPTKRQLSKMIEVEFNYPETRRSDDPMYRSPISSKEAFMPPDHGDICWTKGSETFTRKEVAYLLYTQRSMISNDLKSNCGNDMTKEMFEILNNPRTPEY